MPEPGGSRVAAGSSSQVFRPNSCSPYLKLMCPLQALLNYRWSRVPGPLSDPIEQAIAALITLVYWGTATWYLKEGDSLTSSILTVVGGVQTWSAFFSKA